MGKHTIRDGYAADWFCIAWNVKAEAGWCCEHCGHVHDPENGRCLTVHHLDGNTQNNDYTNLVALCQACHLHIQARYRLGQGFLFDAPAWARERGGMEPKTKYITQRVERLMLLFGDEGELLRVKVGGLGVAFAGSLEGGLVSVSRRADLGDVEGDEAVNLLNDLRLAASECGQPILRFKKIADEEVILHGVRFHVLRFSVFFGEQLRLFDEV